jgi:hypothetical protein
LMHSDRIFHTIGYEKPNDKLSWHYYGCDCNLEMIKSFVECITKDKKPVASGFDGRQGVAITLASYGSASRKTSKTINKIFYYFGYINSSSFIKM